MILRTATVLLALASFHSHASSPEGAWVVWDGATAALFADADTFQDWSKELVTAPGITALLRAAREALMQENAQQIIVMLGANTSLLETPPSPSRLKDVPILAWLQPERELESATALDGMAGLRERAALCGSRIAVLILGARGDEEAEVIAALREVYPETVHWLEDEASWPERFEALWAKMAASPLREPSILGLRRFLRLREDQAQQLRHDLEECVLMAGGLGQAWSVAVHKRLDTAVGGLLSDRQRPRWDRIPPLVRVRLAERIYREVHALAETELKMAPGEPVLAEALARRLRLDEEATTAFIAALVKMQEAFIALMDTPDASGGASPLARLALQLQTQGAESLSSGVMEGLMQAPYAGSDGETYGAAAARLQREALGALREVLSHETLAEFETLELENLFEIDTGVPTLEQVLAARVAERATEAQAPDRELAFWRDLGWTETQGEAARQIIDALKERNTEIALEAPADGGKTPLALLAEHLQRGAADAVPAFVAYLGERQRSEGDTFAEAMAREEIAAREALRELVGEAGLARLSDRFPGSLSEVPTGSDPFDDALQALLP